LGHRRRGRRPHRDAGSHPCAAGRHAGLAGRPGPGSGTPALSPRPEAGLPMKPKKNVSLSVLVPVFNESGLVAASLERLKALARSPSISRLQVVVVDDGSTDGSAEVLRKFEAQVRARPAGVDWIFLKHG